MMISRITRARQRGFTIMDALIGAVLISVSMLALGQLWTFASRVTIDSDDMAVAYNLARQATEQIRQTGFTNTPEGSTSAYYNLSEVSVSAAATSARYEVVSSVTSSVTVPGSSPVQPATDALRTVVVTVTLVSSGQVLFQSGCYLVNGGI